MLSVYIMLCFCCYATKVGKKRKLEMEKLEIFKIQQKILQT